VEKKGLVEKEREQFECGKVRESFQSTKLDL